MALLTSYPRFQVPLISFHEHWGHLAQYHADSDQNRLNHAEYLGII